MTLDLEVESFIEIPDAVLPLEFEFDNELEHIFVVDHYGCKVLKYSMDGELVATFGSSGTADDKFVLPFGIAISEDDRVYISDVGQNRIKVFDTDGEFMMQWGTWGAEPGEFYKPKGMSIDRQGRLIVNDFGNHRGQIFSLDGKYIAEFGIGAGYKAVLRH